MLEEFTGIRLKLRLRVDNDQAIAAVRRGYSKHLKHLQRTHRVSIGAIHECIISDMGVEVSHVDSADNRADIFTKAHLPSPFLRLRNMCCVFDESNEVKAYKFQPEDVLACCTS